MESVLIKKGFELSESEIEQINQAKAREFKAPPFNKRQLDEALFFLLNDDLKVLAMGELIPVEPILFNGKAFSVLGIGGIIANEKGKGYGKKIMAAITNYLSECDKTGVGFCRIYNKGFYEKCGLKVNCDILKRFVFKKEGEAIANRGDDCVIFSGGVDNFMKEVLANPNEDVILPREPDW